MAKVSYKRIAAVLQEARSHIGLHKPSGSPFAEDGCRFICDALVDAGRRLNDDAAVKAARVWINDQIEGHFSLEQWLEINHRIGLDKTGNVDPSFFRDEANFTRLQRTRVAWIDSMLAVLKS